MSRTIRMTCCYLKPTARTRKIVPTTTNNTNTGTKVVTACTSFIQAKPQEKAATAMMNTDTRIPQDVAPIIEQDIHSRIIHHHANPTSIVNTTNKYTSPIGHITLDQSPASTKSQPMYRGYQPKPRVKKSVVTPQSTTATPTKLL